MSNSPNPGQPAVPSAAGAFVYDTRYVEAAVNHRHRVLGRVLAPYSFWHILLLETVQSPLLLDKPVTPQALWQAVHICSSRWNPGFVAPDMVQPSRLRWQWLTTRYRLVVEINKFHEYLRDHDSGPRCELRSDKKLVSCGAHDVDGNFETVCYLQLKGLSPGEAWNMPVGMARWYSAVYSRLEGADLQFRTPVDDMHLERLRRQVAVDGSAKANGKR
ncbi:hypothetical protein OpiT1DRAFT_05613 [Opitutaceae bacterium TAV1]|nr:hypothetical protein OpiT1DRAFT_05613 [Opitutaceae bacterium TAV1]